MKSICETNGFEYRLALRWAEFAATQTLALGGHSLHPLVEQIAGAGGIRDRASRLRQRRGRGGLPRTKMSSRGKSPEAILSPFPFSTMRRPAVFSIHNTMMRTRGTRYRLLPPGGGRFRRMRDCPGCTRSPGRRERLLRGAGRTCSPARQLMQKKHRLKPLYVTARLPREAEAAWAAAGRNLGDETPPVEVPRSAGQCARGDGGARQGTGCSGRKRHGSGRR